MTHALTGTQMEIVQDALIATCFNDALKFCTTLSAKSALECSDEKLRDFFGHECQQGIGRQAQVAQVMAARGWYVPPAAQPEVIQTLAPQLQLLTQGLNLTQVPVSATNTATNAGDAAGNINMNDRRGHITADGLPNNRM